MKFMAGSFFKLHEFCATKIAIYHNLTTSQCDIKVRPRTQLQIRNMSGTALTKKEIESLSEFRYRLRCFLRFSEELTLKDGVTNLQYLLLLHVKGYKGREWATIGELAERLQSHHNGVVSLASRCEKLGLIYRQRGVADKREVEIHLTPEGNRLLIKIASSHRKELLGQRNVFKVPGIRKLKLG
jgi:DNA-binding MarR family transcriptional regulator